MKRKLQRKYTPSCTPVFCYRYHNTTFTKSPQIPKIKCLASSRTTNNKNYHTVSQKSGKAKAFLHLSQCCMHLLCDHWDRGKHFLERNLPRQTSIRLKSNTNCECTQMGRRQFSSTTDNTAQHWLDVLTLTTYMLLLLGNREEEQESTQAYFGGVCGYWPGLETALVVEGSIISTKREKGKKRTFGH